MTSEKLNRFSTTPVDNNTWIHSSSAQFIDIAFAIPHTIIESNEAKHGPAHLSGENWKTGRVSMGRSSRLQLNATRSHPNTSNNAF